MSGVWIEDLFGGCDFGRLGAAGGQLPFHSRADECYQANSAAFMNPPQFRVGNALDFSPHFFVVEPLRPIGAEISIKERPHFTRQHA